MQEELHLFWIYSPRRKRHPFIFNCELLNAFMHVNFEQRVAMSIKPFQLHSHVSLQTALTQAPHIDSISIRSISVEGIIAFCSPSFMLIPSAAQSL